jgi:transposase-like protein
VRKKRRPNYSPEFRKQLAQRAAEPGVSVSRPAQENGINANMLYKWRRQLREGRLDGSGYIGVLSMLPLNQKASHMARPFGVCQQSDGA